MKDPEDVELCEVMFAGPVTIRNMSREYYICAKHRVRFFLRADGSIYGYAIQAPQRIVQVPAGQCIFFIPHEPEDDEGILFDPIHKRKRVNEPSFEEGTKFKQPRKRGRPRKDEAP